MVHVQVQAAADRCVEAALDELRTRRTYVDAKDVNLVSTGAYGRVRCNVALTVAWRAPHACLNPMLAPRFLTTACARMLCAALACPGSRIDKQQDNHERELQNI